MATRGKPIPFTLRQLIREYRSRRLSERRIAILLNVNRRTVRKYLGKVCTTKPDCKRTIPQSTDINRQENLMT